MNLDFHLKKCAVLFLRFSNKIIQSMFSVFLYAYRHYICPHLSEYTRNLHALKLTRVLQKECIFLRRFDFYKHLWSSIKGKQKSTVSFKFTAVSAVSINIDLLKLYLNFGKDVMIILGMQ